MQLCSSGDEKSCKLCEGANCNKRLKPLNCVVCSSEKNENCTKKPQSAPTMECDHYDDKCITIMHNNETVVRGCQKHTAVEQSFCDENPWLCNTCESDNCNTIMTIDKYCYECESKTNPDCATKVDDTMLINCPLAKSPGCYHLINTTGNILKFPALETNRHFEDFSLIYFLADSTVSRGCLANLEDSDIPTCEMNGELCKTCQHSACNLKKSFASCVTSSVTSGQKISGHGTKICDDYDDKCFIHVDKDTVIRGCLHEYVAQNNISRSSLKDRIGRAVYKTCSSPMCNDDEIETEFCIHCTSADDPKCKDNVGTKMRKKCNLSDKLKGCYHYEDLENDLVIRGCVTEIEENKSKMNESGDSLKFCFGIECNSKARFQRCLESDLELNSIKVCPDYNDECYIHVANDIIHRGCISDTKDLPMYGVDIEADCKIGDVCEKCSGTDVCNDKVIEKEHCMKCDSKNHPLCDQAPQPNMTIQCPLAIKPVGCYLFKDQNQFVQRGCLSHEPGHFRKMCREQGKCGRTV